MTKQQFLAKNLKALTANTGMVFKDLNAMSLEELQDLMPSEDIFEEESSGEYEANIYLNLDIVLPNGKQARITGVRLDSDFVQYMDKDHTKPNVVAQSLLQTIENKGVSYANEKAEFKVTITKQGESSVELTDELF